MVRGGKGRGTGNGEGAGTRGIGWDGTRGGGGGSKGTGGGGSQGEECASTHLATSETEDRWVLPSADWYRRVGCQPGERVGSAERLPVCGERKMGIGAEDLADTEVWVEELAACQVQAIV